MAATKGKDIFVSDGVGGGATPIVAQRSASMTIDGEAVDVTSRDDAGWRKLIAGAGVAKVSIKAEGIVDSAALQTTLMTRAMTMTVNPYTMTFANGDTLTGDFQLTQYEAKGEYNGTQTYAMTWESAGALTLTPV